MVPQPNLSISTAIVLKRGLGRATYLAGSALTSQDIARYRKVTIVQRGIVDGTPVDVTCIGRFYDFLEKREGRWGLVRRQPIYELDRMDVVDPSVTIKLDPTLLNRFPVGYRHVAYVQTKLGFTVNDNLPELNGPIVSKLYAQGQAWLDGATTTFAKTE